MIDTATTETTTTPVAPVAQTAAPETKPAEAAPTQVETKAEPAKSEDEILAEIYREAQAEGDKEAKTATVATGEEDDAKPIRNEKGQFVSQKAEPDAATPEGEKPAEAKTEEPKTKPNALSEGHFRGWSQEKRDAFAKLPAETQSFVIQHQRDLQSQHSKREADLTKETKALKPLSETVSKFKDYLDQVGSALNAPPHEIIAGLMETERALRFGNHDQKLKTLLGMAQDYGIKLTVDETAQEDPAVHDLRQENARLKAQLDQGNRRSLQQREHEEASQVSAEIEKFATATDATTGELKYPHFDALRPVMAKLMSTGEAESLEDAYRIAFEPMRQAVEAEKRKALSQADLAKATRPGRINVTSAPVPVHQYANEDEVLKASYRQAMSA